VGNGERIAYRFVTLSVPELTPLYRWFYPNGRKVAPELSLTPLTLAVWLMDDGSRSRTSVYLNTQQFDVHSQLRLLASLQNQWVITATLNRDKKYFRIRISVEGTRLLRDIVMPHLLPELRYKLPHDPVTTEAVKAEVARRVSRDETNL
jgi:hypothetical protein